MLQAFPSLTPGEFEQACQILEQRCHDNIQGTNWQRVYWNSLGELRIRQMSTQDNDDRAAGQVAGSDIEASIEEDDMEAIKVTSTRYERPTIDFSIVLSATYQVPVLWFALSSHSPISLSDLERIYSEVVSPQSRGSLQQVGVMGGISIANHPLTERPMFFIHPCNTPETLSALNDGSNLGAFDYLLLWFGMIGAAVGLHVPSMVLTRGPSFVEA